MENEEIKKVESNEMLFFLGAGASVAAGVPSIAKFADDFEKNINKKRIILEKIKKNYGEITVESLLKAAYSLNGENENALDSSELSLLKKEIVQFVREKVILSDRAFAEVGASITQELVNEFEENIRKNADALEKIRDILKEKREIIDVELLLEALHELNNRSKYVLPDISELNAKLKGREYELESLEKDLRRFIREKTIVREDKIGYLAPLKEFVDAYKTLDIFSVNYDTCIEQFCKKHNFSYTDGFDLNWNPDLFKDDYKIKLYKIHGSVTWYKTDEGTYIKIPTASVEDEIELITGEKAKTLMVYPLPGKFEEYSTPRSEFIPILRKKLEEVKVCIAIGYRFRDEDIRTIFFEAAKKASQRNEGLFLFLIAPDAGKIYDDRLKFIDKDKRKTSSLEGRVICWNYPVENVLKENYLYRSVKKLSDILKGLEEAQKVRRERGSKIYAFEQGMQEVVSKCIDIGYTSLAERILERELDITADNLKESHLFVDGDIDKLRILLGIGVNHLYSGRYDKAKGYFYELKEIIERSRRVGNEYFELNNRLTALKKERKEELSKEIEKKIEVIITNNKVLPFYTWFMWSVSDGRWSRCLQYDFIDFLNKEIELRSINDDISKHLFQIIEKCNQMRDYLEIPFKEGIYEDSDDINIGAQSVETRRKTDAEEKLKEIIKAFEDLIDFCEERENPDLDQIRA